MFFSLRKPIERGEKDYLNESGSRSVKTVNAREYNCGGYALNTFTWYRPHKEREHIIYGDEYEELTEKDLEKNYSYCVSIMLKDFPSLRIIKDIKELQKNEYAIAFRLGGLNGGTNDFHFMKRAKNGCWTHKMGQGYIERIKKEPVFSDAWHAPFGDYKGKIILFAKKF